MVMKNGPDFEIPETMRELAEKSVEQAHDAYNRFMDAARNATDMVDESSHAVTEGAKDVQKTALSFFEDNLEANFKHAEALVKAKDLKEALEIQSDFARKQMEAFAEQAQELSGLLADTASKVKPKK